MHLVSPIDRTPVPARSCWQHFRRSRACVPVAGAGAGSPLRRLLVVLAVACLAACAQTGQQQREPSAAAPVDFSGNWELNFAQSDNVQAQMSALVRNLRKQAERE